MITFSCNEKNLCEDFNCKVTKTDKGIEISFSSDNKEKVEELHKMTDSCKTTCCDNNKSTSCC